MNILLSRSRVKSATNYNEVRFPDNGLRIFFMNIFDHYSFLLSWLIFFFCLPSQLRVLLKKQWFMER